MEAHCHAPILFDSHTIQLVSKSRSAISLSFDEDSEALTFSCQQNFIRINEKTVVAALQRTDSGKVTAELIRRAKLEYHLVVKVNEDFLMPIQETFVLIGRQMTKSEREGLKIKQEGKQRVCQLRDSFIEYAGQCMQAGSEMASVHGVSFNVALPFPTTLYTFHLTFANLTDNIVFIQLFYSGRKGRREELQVLPKEGLFVLNQTEFCAVVDKKGFEEITMGIKGSFSEVKYLIKSEKVESDMNHRDGQRRLMILIGILVIVVLFAGSIIMGSEESML